MYWYKKCPHRDLAFARMTRPRSCPNEEDGQPIVGSEQKPAGAVGFTDYNFSDQGPMLDWDKSNSPDYGTAFVSRMSMLFRR